MMDISIHGALLRVVKRNALSEFLEENDALLKNQDKIPFKYISDIHYGKKTVWKNPDFES